MKEVEIWTDGASKGNPGPGGWGAWMKYKGHVLELCGGALSTTNNQMELTAPTEALCRLKEPCKVTLHTDSKYVQQGMTAWIYGWIKKGWKTADGSPVKNADLWKNCTKPQNRMTLNGFGSKVTMESRVMNARISLLIWALRNARTEQEKELKNRVESRFIGKHG